MDFVPGDLLALDTFCSQTRDGHQQGSCHKIITPLATTVSSKTDAFSTANWGRAQGGTIIR